MSPADRRQPPIYNLRRFGYRFDSGVTNIDFILDSVWPKRAMYSFHATAKHFGDPEMKTNVSIGWKMLNPQSKRPGYFDPVIERDNLDAGESEAFAFAARLAHEALECDDVIVTAPRELTEKAAAAYMLGLSDPMGRALRDHLKWFTDEALARADLTTGES